MSNADYIAQTGRTVPGAAQSPQNGDPARDLGALDQRMPSNVATGTSALDKSVAGGQMAGNTAPQMQPTHMPGNAATGNSALDQAVTPRSGAGSLTAQTTAGQIDKSSLTNASDWAHTFQPRLPVDWDKINSDPSKQFNGPDSPDAPSGAGSNVASNDDEDDLIKKMRGAVSVPGSDAPGQSYQSPQMQNDAYA